MTDTPCGVIVDQLTKVLREAFEGPPGPWSYFTDRFPESGLLGTIRGVSAPDASRPAGAQQTTIAGHVQHLCISMAIATWWMRGELVSRDRNTGWAVRMVDETAWRELQATLRRGYETLVVEIGTRVKWDEEALGGAIGAIAHVAYHLGALRQRLLLDGSDKRANSNASRPGRALEPTLYREDQ
jgi:hypothetical protein